MMIVFEKKCVALGFWGGHCATLKEETRVSEEGVSMTTIRVSSLRNLYMENVLLRRLRDISSCRRLPVVKLFLKHYDSTILVQCSLESAKKKTDSLELIYLWPDPPIGRHSSLSRFPGRYINCN